MSFNKVTVCTIVEFVKLKIMERIIKSQCVKYTQHKLLIYAEFWKD